MNLETGQSSATAGEDSGPVRIRRRSSLSFHLLSFIAVACAVVVACTIYFSMTFSEHANRGAALTQNLEETVRLSQQLSGGISVQLDLLLAQFEHVEADFPDQLNQMNFSLGRIRSDYLRLDLGEEERLTVEDISASLSDFVVQSLLTYEQLRAGDREEASVQLEKAKALHRNMETEVERLNHIQTHKLRVVFKRMDGAARYFDAAMLSLLGTLGAFVLLFALLLRRRVLGPLSNILRIADRIRDGDLAARVEVGGRDDLARLGQALNHMAEALQASYARLEHKVDQRSRQLEEAQEQLIESEKMAAIGQLVSGVAHEVNNPLTVIMGLAELTQMEVAENAVTPDTEGLLREIVEQVHRCKRIVSNLLLFARRQEPHKEAISVNEAVGAALRLREYEFSTHKINLIRDFDENDPVISADPNKVQQLVLNIVNNAHDAVQTVDGQREIRVATAAAGDMVHIVVEDTGPGIEDTTKAFEPFYTTKEPGKGTGLGLSVCYGIVHQHGGTIRVENSDTGARVIVDLPRYDPDADTLAGLATPSSGVPALSRRYDVLLVDDEEVITTVASAFLRRMGMEVHTAATGEDALAVLERREVDLVISDLRMPGDLDGLDLFAWVRKNRPLLVRRFLFVSGDLSAFAPGCEADKFNIPRIQKPFTFDGLAFAVHELLEAERNNHG